jgi:hypothetical protein
MSIQQITPTSTLVETPIADQTAVQGFRRLALVRAGRSGFELLAPGPTLAGPERYGAHWRARLQPVSRRGDHNDRWRNR